MSLSRDRCRRRLKHKIKSKIPATTIIPPTLATAIAIFWDLVKVGSVALVAADDASAAVAVLAFDVFAGVPVEVDSVVGVGVPELLRELVELLEELELEVELAAGAIKTMLGIEVWTMTVAVIVLWVLGIAFSLPLHILNAFAATSSTFTSVFFFRTAQSNDLLPASAPLQNPTLSSDIIHCIAPSPTVYPLVLLFEQRQSRVGLFPHMVGKLFSRKDSKHV